MTTESTHNSPLAAEIRANWPALSFYYGLSFKQLRKMPRWAREEYAKQLPGFLASKQLRAIEAATFPWADENTRNKIMDGLEAHVDGTAAHAVPAPVATPNSDGESRGIRGIPAPKSVDEMALLAGASGFGFVKEPGKHSEADFEGQLRRRAAEERKAKEVSTDA